MYDFAKSFDIVKTKPLRGNIEFYKLGENKYLRKRKGDCLVNHYKYNAETQTDKFFFSLLVLFKPWRTTDELKNQCSNYAEAFSTVKASIPAAENYYKKLCEVGEAFERVEKLVQEKLEGQNSISNIEPDEPMECIPLEACEDTTDLKEMDSNVEHVELGSIISKLKNDQQRVFNHITRALRQGESLRMYVSGEGGTGKSFLIYALRIWVKQELNKVAAL